jgi:hypothetical protein
MIYSIDVILRSKTSQNSTSGVSKLELDVRVVELIGYLLFLQIKHHLPL